MDYPKTKVYFDGSHYIGIPHTTQPWKIKKNKPKQKNKTQEKVKELFQKAKDRLDKTKYGCRKDNHEIFRIKDKIFCGCYNRKMYPVSAISSNGNSIKYYKCITTKKKNCTTGNIDKNFVESIVDRFLISQFNIQKNLDEITEKIFDIYKNEIKAITLLML